MKDRDRVCPHEPRTRLGHLLDPTEMCDFVQRCTLARSILLRAVCFWWWWLDYWICIRSMLHVMEVVKHSGWDSLHMYVSRNRLWLQFIELLFRPEFHSNWNCDDKANFSILAVQRVAELSITSSCWPGLLSRLWWWWVTGRISWNNR